MTSKEKRILAEHYGHDVRITDYEGGEPIPDEGDLHGRFCLECVTCEDQILLGDRVEVAVVDVESVEFGDPDEDNRHST